MKCRKTHLKFLKFSVQRRSFRRRCGLKPIQILLLAALLFFSALVSFIVTIYFSSDLIQDIYGRYAYRTLDPSLLPNSVSTNMINYQPRIYSGKEESLRIDKNIRYKDFDFRRPETITYTKEQYSNRSSLVYRLPQKRSVIGVLLFFHNCYQTSTNLFHLLETQRIIGAAIDLGFACLAFNASNRVNRCWSTTANLSLNRDVRMVERTLYQFYEQFPTLSSLPRLTYGISSGGLFSSIFAMNQHYPILGQVISISIILPQVLNILQTKQVYPPTAWIHMLRDTEFASEERLIRMSSILKNYNVTTKSFLVEPISLTIRIFIDRIPNLRVRTATFLFNRLQSNRWLNALNYLTYNPRRKEDWKWFLFPSDLTSINDKQVQEDLEKYQSEITEFLYVAYGEHAMTYERSFEALQWLRTICNISQEKPSKSSFSDAFHFALPYF